MEANGSPIESAIARVGWRGTMSSYELLDEVQNRLKPNLSAEYRKTIIMLMDELSDAIDAFGEGVLTWGRIKDSGSHVNADMLRDVIRRQHKALVDLLSALAIVDNDQEALERVIALKKREEEYIGEVVRLLNTTAAGAVEMDGQDCVRH